jgi:hypothetical protein
MWPKLPEAKKPVSEKRTYQELAPLVVLQIVVVLRTL